MRLVGLLQHFFNNNIDFYERLPDWQHDVYFNPKTKRRFTIPIKEDEIPDYYCQLGCIWLEIEGINGESYEQLIKKMSLFIDKTKEKDIN